VQQAREAHTDYSSVNALLFRRAPKIQNRERYIYNAIGFCHICVKVGYLIYTVVGICECVCVCVSSSSTDPFRNTLTHANCTQVSLIAWTAYSLCFHVILVSLDGLEALVQLLLLAWILTGIAINYFMCIFLDNSIPDCWYVV
jgi:hypothetical protein